MGKKPAARQPSPMWVTTADLPTSAGHPFFERLNRVLEDRGKHEEANQGLMALAMTLTVVLLGVLAAIGKHPRLGPDFTGNVRTTMDRLEDHLGKEGSTYSAFMSEFKTEMRHVREIRTLRAAASPGAGGPRRAALVEPIPYSSRPIVRELPAVTGAAGPPVEADPRPRGGVRSLGGAGGLGAGGASGTHRYALRTGDRARPGRLGLANGRGVRP